MSKAHYRVWHLNVLGVLFALSAVFILFISPTDILYENSRRMHLGDIFRSLEALIGSAAARFLLALPFGVISYLFLRKAQAVRDERHC